MSESRDGLPVSLYSRTRAPYELVHAVQLTPETFERCSGLPNVDVIHRNPTQSLVFRDEALGREVAEIGDYIVLDHAGRAWPVDKEIFEAKYAR